VTSIEPANTSKRFVAHSGEARAELKYRPDIDGMRAIAVLIVVGYHAAPEWVHGGFIGVDLFFVISGYLITNIIQRHLNEGDFSIIDFYKRRIRRIFPALLVVTFACFVAGWFLLSPNDFASLGTNIAGGAVFIQNFVLMHQVGYFDIEAAKKPLLHLWSLGIEEQYYVVWPLLLILIARSRWDTRVVTGFLLLSSLAAGFVTYGLGSHTAAFFLPFTRAWELLAGSILSLPRDPAKRSWPIVEALPRHWDAQLSGNAPKRRWALEVVAAGALVAIVLSVLRHKPYAPIPGAATIVPVIAACILMTTANSMVNRRLLAFGPLVFIGLISYPLYLWHFPLMAFARGLSLTEPSIGTMALLVSASGVLAWCTFTLLELPLRNQGGLANRNIVTLVAGMTAIGTIGLAVIRTDGFPNRMPQELRRFLENDPNLQARWRAGTCLLLPEQGPDAFSGCAGTGTHPLLLLWGDSFMAAFTPGLEQFGRAHPLSFSQYTSSACPPLLGFTSDFRPLCKANNDRVLAQIQQEKPDLVILHSMWHAYDTQDDIDAGFGRTIPALHAMGIRNVLVIGPMPTWQGKGLPSNLVDYYFTHDFMLIPRRSFFRSMDVLTHPLDLRMRSRVEALGARYISARDLLCDADGCLTRFGDQGENLTAFDIGHMPAPASIRFVNQIGDQLIEFAR
jgi:peptidoglycan/LPS O-acetylase OafA/YrhL